MNELMSFLAAHSFWTGVIAYWIYAASVDSLPDPTEASGGFYKFAYAFMHKIAGNLSVTFSDKIPGTAPKP